METNDPSTSTASTGSKHVTTYASLAEEFNRSPARHGYMNSGVSSSKGVDYDSRFAIVINADADIPQQLYADAVSDILKCPTALNYIGRRSNKLLIFLNKVSYVQAVVSTGIYVKNKWVEAKFLEAPIKKVVISNVNPDVPNGVLLNYLKRYGEIVEAPKPMSAGLKGDLSHVRSLRRECGMILADGHTDIDDSFEFTRGKYTHRIFIATGGLVCFECKRRGHTRNFCPTLRNVQQQEKPLEKKDIIKTRDVRKMPEIDDDGFQTVTKGRRTKNLSTRQLADDNTVQRHIPEEEEKEEEESHVGTTVGAYETSSDESSSDSVVKVKKTSKKNKLRMSSDKSSKSVKTRVMNTDIVSTDKSTENQPTSSTTVIPTVSSSTVISTTDTHPTVASTTVTTPTVAPTTVAQRVTVTNTTPFTVSSNVNYNILDPKSSAPIFTLSSTDTKTTSLNSRDDFPPLFAISDDVNMTLDTPPPPNIKRPRAFSFPELEDAEPPPKQPIVLKDASSLSQSQRCDSLSSLCSTVSVSSSVLCDDSEDEEMAQLAAQQDLTIPPHSQEEVLSFFMSIKKKKKHLRRCEDFYPDLRYLLRQLIELKLVTGLATTDKKRLYKLIKLIRKELLQRKSINSAVSDSELVYSL